MREGIYTIFDAAANETGPLYNTSTDALAIRNFYNAMKDVPPEVLSDYSLWRIGYLVKTHNEDDPIDPVRTKLFDSFEIVAFATEIVSEMNKQKLTLINGGKEDGRKNDNS